MLSALDTFLTFYKQELQPDVWMMYVNMPCPCPFTHELVGFCTDCENKYFELEGKDIPTLQAVRSWQTLASRWMQISGGHINETEDSKKLSRAAQAWP